MRIDKTYSELWDLVDTHEDATVQETAKLAINTLQKLQEENRKLDRAFHSIFVKNQKYERLKEVLKEVLDEG